jgi:fructose-1,6-bisphosphatase II
MEPAQKQLSRNLGLELVRVTEATALAAGRWMGFGDTESADRAAAQTMVNAVNTLDINGTIVIGEESMVDIGYSLGTGQLVGTGAGDPMDVVLDPIDGVRILAKSHSDAISVIAVTPRGAMLSLAPAVYMDKIIVDHEAAGAIVPECMDAPAAWTLALVARVKKKPVRDLVVFVLDRPRHQDLIQEIHAAGARVLLRSDGDVAGALATLTHARADIVMGVGGVIPGLTAACAVKSLGGAMLSRLAPQSAEERLRIEKAGLDTQKIYTSDDLVSGNEIFFAATGITDGAVLSGVLYQGDKGRTESLVLSSQTGSQHLIRTTHTLLADSTENDR